LDETNKALLTVPNSVPALIQKGAILAELKRFDESLIALRQALQFDANCPSALNAYAWIIADDLPQPTREQLDEARVRVQRAIEILPDPNSYDTAGWVLFKLGSYREAVEALEQAREGQSEDRQSTVWQAVNFHLGMVNLRLGKNREAKRAFQEVVDFGQHPTSNEEYVRQAKEHMLTLQARVASSR
jgi:tetratricopeptide (TPR) repeat protein